MRVGTDNIAYGVAVARRKCSRFYTQGGEGMENYQIMNYTASHFWKRCVQMRTMSVSNPLKERNTLYSLKCNHIYPYLTD